MTDIINNSPDWLAKLIFPIAFVLLLILKKIVFSFIKAKLVHKAEWIKNTFLPATRRPITLLIWALAISLIPVVYDLPKKWDSSFSFGSKILGGLAIAFFIRNLLLIGIQKFTSQNPTFKTSSGLLNSVVSFFVFSLVIVALLETAGISVTPIIASLGIGSVAIALALQDTLKSLFSGFYIILDQPIRVGDYIRIDSTLEGYVENIGWRSTRLWTSQNNTIIVTNSKLSESTLINFHKPQTELSMAIEGHVAYGSDLEKVEKITLEVARETLRNTPGAVATFEPTVRFQTFGENAIFFTVSLRAKQFSDQGTIKHAFIKNLHARYQKEGIIIPVKNDTQSGNASPSQTPLK